MPRLRRGSLPPTRRTPAQVVIGEQRGEGVRMGCRCFWDPDTDAYAEDTYRNVRRFGTRTWRRTTAQRARRRRPIVPASLPPLRPLSPCWQDSLFCVAAAFGSYLY